MRNTMVAAGLLTSIAISALIPVVYSYLLWSREHGGPSNGTL